MSSPYPEPIAELVVQDVIASLEQVPTLIVEREKQGGNAPARNGLCVVYAGDPVPEFEKAPCGHDEYVLPVEMLVVAIESELSGVSVSQRLYGHAADIRRQLMQDRHRGGFAVNTEFRTDDRLNTAESPASVVVKAWIRFRTKFADPYSL